MDLLSNIKEQLVAVEMMEEALKPTENKKSLECLYQEQDKLKYQLEHLKEALATAEQRRGQRSVSVLGALTSLFDEAIRAACPEQNGMKVSLSPCGSAKFGDYQCNNAMTISKKLKQQGQAEGVAPRDIAERIVAALPACANEVIARAEVAPAGFINIHLSRSLIAAELAKIVRHGVTPPLSLAAVVSQRVVVDYSSPNVAKEMHVGHLRSTIIGDCLARFFRFLGADTLALNHIGDWGTQFGMLIAHLLDCYPEFLSSGQCPPIGDLQKFYKASKTRFDNEDEFKKRAYEAVVRLQSHQPHYLAAWRLICDVSRAEFQKIYQRLDIHDLEERGESFYQDKMASLVAQLEVQGLLELDEGRQLLRSPHSDVHLLMVKSDGGYTYDTSDLAALKHRTTVERADRILYVVDQGQAAHFHGLFACAKTAGIVDQRRIEVRHVEFGVVLGEDGSKFKSRSSETVRLADLLDEGMARALAKLQEKGRDKELTTEELQLAQKAVAYGCIKYADLSHHRIKDYTFSFDKMLEDKGNTAVYLLYTYTRISGIGRKAQVSRDQLLAEADKMMYHAAADAEQLLEHEAEWKLAKVVARLPEVLEKLAEDLTPHALCEYLYSLCTAFAEFYEACYCVQKCRETGTVLAVHLPRVLLAEATAAVLRTGFHILGLNHVSRM